MRGEEDVAQLARRLDELAVRTARTGQPCFTGFLSPPESDAAQAAGRKQGVETLVQGGYEDAERCMVCFAGDWEEPFPITAIALTWPHQSAPGHRDILGSVMGLGIERRCIGDIVLTQDTAYLFAESNMAGHIAASLTSAGRVKLQTRLLDIWPQLEPPKGMEVRDTVSGLRLDAVVSGGFCLSRANAAELITTGKVKLRHLPNERPDARVKEGDVISARGYGRLVVQEVGAPTKKGRLPLKLIRYGESR